MFSMPISFPTDIFSPTMMIFPTQVQSLPSRKRDTTLKQGSTFCWERPLFFKKTMNGILYFYGMTGFHFLFPKNRPLRWGVIGCGSVAEKKSGPAYQNTQDFEVVMVMRRDSQKAKDYAQRHHIAQWTT